MSGDPASAKVPLDGIEPRELAGIEPTLLSVGDELRPGEMRPNVRRFDAREATNDHRHESQKELHVVLEGGFDVSAEGEDGEREEFDLVAGEYLVVPPTSWRRLTAADESLLLVVGAPPARDDDVRREGA
jgi:quercetin dioxygenase-like cupin family protein